MNPRNPSQKDMREAEMLFFQQMKRNTEDSTRPAGQMQLLRSLDLQFSDRWLEVSA